MSNLDLLHQVDLDIVKAVTALCDRHGLKPYMLGGTMLGAVRHGGFIPWDDDIDLGLFRDDYEKFQALASELPGHLKIVNYRNSPSYQYYITRVMDTETQVIEERIGNESRYTHASIDIFPIDGTPNNALLRKLYFFRVLYHRALMSLCYKDSIDRKRKRGGAEKALERLKTLLGRGGAAPGREDDHALPTEMQDRQAPEKPENRGGEVHRQPHGRLPDPGDRPGGVLRRGENVPL